MFIFKYLETLPWVYGVLLVALLFIIFAVAGALLIRKYVGTHRLTPHHEVAGYVFTNLGVLYAVLLGFIVVNVQEHFNQSKASVQIEASYLAELYQDAEIFPEKTRIAIRNSIIDYIRSVVDEEWQLMSQGVSSPKAIQNLQKIWIGFYEYDPINQKEVVRYTQSINKLNQLMEVRISRLISSEESLGTEMWSLLIVGGIVMISFIWFFGLENIFTHLLMASIIAAITAFLLFLIYSLDTAFIGNMKVSSEPFERILTIMNYN